jgi:autophagy-related protein 27
VSVCLFRAERGSLYLGARPNTKRLNHDSLVLGFIGYFLLGAYYNYTTYGASGSDLIPYVPSLAHVVMSMLIVYLCRHRDFWREVPYMLRDVVSHLCSSFRPRHSSSRGGYIAV